MKGLLIKFFIMGGLLLGLPLLGICLAGYPLQLYLEFPPETRYVVHAPFSWIAFAVYCLFIISFFAPFILRGFRGNLRVQGRPSPVRSFPWWGWVAAGAGLISWILAWTRFDWFSHCQPHTFTPIWISFILVVNALAFQRTGRCMMLQRPGFFLVLFPVSAAFWWFFEYLNRFVQNWYYVGVDFSPLEYFWYATLSFSTVLPAVLGVRELMLASSWLDRVFKSFMQVRIASPRAVAWASLLASCTGLAGIGIWTDYLFPLLWVSPLLIMVSLQALLGEDHIFRSLRAGDWRPVVSSALAALVCGWFWEMWNFFSLAKWEYAVPFVNRFKIFEMPVLGFAGYLPFGLEAAVVGHILGSAGRPSAGNRAGRGE